uniref:non-specific serine/threonine protein kinase n=1 Tax=Parascaris univalens TaxID=6257 RepID=A0A915BIS7_PARUN
MPHPKYSSRKSKGKEDDERLVESGSDEDSEDSDEEDRKKKAIKKGTKEVKKSHESKKIKNEKPKIPIGPMARKKMSPGVVINTDLHKYEILAVLGAGGFGDVYKVQQMDNSEKKIIYALKTETNGPNGKSLNRLKVEMTIFEECERLPRERKRHFVEMIDKGRTENFKFIVMELVGTSIDNLQKKMPRKRFSFSTTIKLGLETVEAIGHLHDLGYIHRDIKPQNFTVGVAEKADNIYLLDFGIARRYTEKYTKAIRIPRRQVKFIGTIRFASRNCHLGKEQSRRDDLESWLYMLLEFTQYAILPWSRTINREIVLREKQKLFSGKFIKHVADLPSPIHRIIYYIDDLTFQGTPDYEYIGMALKRAAALKDADLNEPFDWNKPKEVDSEEDVESAKKSRSLAARKKTSKTGGNSKASKRKTMRD